MSLFLFFCVLKKGRVVPKPDFHVIVSFFLCVCRPRSVRDIVREALSRIGEIGYNVLWNNCEHFASYCRYGVKWSEQVCHFGIFLFIHFIIHILVSNFWIYYQLIFIRWFYLGFTWASLLYLLSYTIVRCLNF